MEDRGILKWVILGIIFIIIIFIVITVFNKPTEVKEEEPSVTIVETPKEIIDEPIEEPAQNQTVDSPDTASSGLPETIIGMLITTYGLHYIHSHQIKKGIHN